MTDVTLIVELSDADEQRALILAEVLGVSVSELVKMAVDEYLTRHDVRVG